MIKINLKNLVPFILIWFTGFHLAAQQRWAHLYNDYGFQAMTLHKDTVWVGGYVGLFKYSSSGQLLAKYDKFNSPLETGIITDIQIDTLTGAKWIATEGAGIYRFLNGTWQSFNKFNSALPSNRINSITIESTNKIWVGSIFGHLSRYENGIWTNFNIRESQLVDIKLLIDGSQRKWILSKKLPQPLSFNENTGIATESVILSNGSGTINCYTIDQSATKRLCIGTTYGFYTYDNNNVLEHYLKSQYPNAFSSDTISKLMAIDNKIWMLTQAGISVYDAQTKITKEVDKFSNKGFNKLIDYFGVDKNGYYWLSGEDYIVRGSPPTSLLPISNASSKIEKNTRVVFRDSKGDYWFGTGDKGVFVKHDTVWKNYKFQTGNIFQDFFVNSIFDIKQDTTGKIWVATYNNIFTFDGQNWSDLGYFGDGAKVIHFDKKNRAWIASSYGLMVPRANGIGWSRYHQDVTPDKFKGFYAFDLAFEGDSTVWVSTGGGITRLQLPDSTWTNWTNVQLGNKSSLRNILVHEKGKVWVATDSSGIMEFNGTNIKYYNTQNSGINHNWIWKMQQDTTGTIWFATQQGLSKLNKNNEWQSFDGTNSPFYTYTGLMDSRTTTRQGSADVNFMSIDRSGYIWLVQNRSIGLFTYFTGNITPTNEIPMSEKYSPLFKIYPNPNKGSFTIDLLSNEQGNIEILNTMGVSIYKIPISQQSFSIHLPFLTKGLYFLRLQTLKGFDVQKMVVD